jgi:chromosome segregation ATPase
LDDKYREKEAHLEKALAHKSDLEDQLQKLRANHEHTIKELEDQLQQLHSESTELRQQIVKASEDIATWRGDCQAKTQQVKQYSKQVEQFRVQVDGLTAELKDNRAQVDGLTAELRDNRAKVEGLTAELRDKRAKISEYEQQLEYYQEQVRQLDEDDEQKVRLTMYMHICIILVSHRACLGRA